MIHSEFMTVIKELAAKDKYATEFVWQTYDLFWKLPIEIRIDFEAFCSSYLQQSYATVIDGWAVGWHKYRDVYFNYLTQGSKFYKADEVTEKFKELRIEKLNANLKKKGVVNV